jgi:radical SAM superfamily enzyme YgiQ (UPF0313 family)
VRILFIYPNLNHELIGYGDLGAIAEPLALEYLAASCVDLATEMELLDLRLHPNELNNRLTIFNPDVIAITGYSMHVMRIQEIAQLSRERLPSSKVVVGGHHATLLAEDFKIPEIDFIVVGEGTAPFAKLIKLFSDESENSSVPGVWKNTHSGWEFGGDQSELQLDQVAPPLRSLCIDDRSHYFIDWMKPIALMRTTVGCPYRCTFCSLWKMMDGYYYKREVDAVITELKEIKEPYVFLVDDEPFVNSKRMDVLADSIRESGIQKEYFSYCRIDTLLRNKSTLKKWVDIGLRRVFLGIEGITEDEIENYNKGLSIAQIEDGLKAARELGLKVFASFIVNPNYSKADFTRLSRFIERNRIDYPSFTILTPLPGTDDFIQQYDQITAWQSSHRPDWSKWDLQHLVVPSNLSPREFEKEYKNLRRNFRGAYEIHQRKAIAARDDLTLTI